MPRWVFHQNMRNFGGHAEPRVTAYEKALASIAANHLQKGNVHQGVAAIGFTEVTSPSDRTEAAIKGIATSLDTKLTRVKTFSSGRTGASRDEYVVVALHTSCKVTAAGRVVRTSEKKWKCVPGVPGLAPVQDSVVDSRGLVYVAVEFPLPDNTPQRLILAFCHNMYKVGDRTGAFQSLPAMAASIRAQHPDVDSWQFLAGGDWNIEPRDPHPRYPTIKSACERTNDVPEKTTKKRCIDFWVTDRPAESLTPHVWRATRHIRSKLSDHAAIAVCLK